MKAIHFVSVVVLVSSALADLHLAFATCGEAAGKDAASSAAVAVVIADDASGLEQFAAAELQRYLRRLFGVSVTVASSPDDSAGSRFVLGTPRRMPRAGLDESLLPPLSDQGFLLRKTTWRNKPGMAIVGGTPAATMWGVYELVERYGDSDDPERVSRRALVRLPGWHGMAQFVEDQAIYRRALEAVRGVPIAARAEGPAYVHYWEARLEFAVRYFDALTAVRKGALAEKAAQEAKQRGDERTYLAHLDEACQQAAAAYSAAFQAIDTYASVAKNRADAGAGATMAEYVCRPLSRIVEKLRAERDGARRNISVPNR